jgi:hypothetical protein
MNPWERRLQGKTIAEMTSVTHNDYQTRCLRLARRPCASALVPYTKAPDRVSLTSNRSGAPSVIGVPVQLFAHLQPLKIPFVLETKMTPGTIT